MESPSGPKEQAPEQAEQDKKTNVWRGTPRVWERCIFCEINKKCSAAGVVRGSSACVDARYSLIKGRSRT